MGEMDGFKENKGVIVVGATNRVDILDSALLRPGRFDRQVTVNLPDRLGRIDILKIHARNKPISDDVSLVQIANRTPGFSGADLANLLNEAAILATRYKKATISKNEVTQAIDRIIGGIAGTPMEDSKNKKLIAYHEVGHAVTGTVLQSHDEVEKNYDYSKRISKRFNMVYTRRGSKFSISFSIISTYYWNIRRTCGRASYFW